MDQQRFRDLLHSTRGIPIAQAPRGTRAKIVGRLVAGSQTVVGPLSGQPCFAYDLLVRGYTRGRMIDPTVDATRLAR